MSELWIHTINWTCDSPPKNHFSQSHPGAEILKVRIVPHHPSWKFVGQNFEILGYKNAIFLGFKKPAFFFCTCLIYLVARLSLFLSSLSISVWRWLVILSRVQFPRSCFSTPIRIILVGQTIYFTFYKWQLSKQSQSETALRPCLILRKLFTTLV